MTPQDWHGLLQQFRAIAVIRAPKFETGFQMAKAAAEGGIRLIEITWNSDRAADLIHKLRQQLPHCTIGAGTLLQPADLHEAIAAGAQFLFTPHTDLHLIQLAVAETVPIIPRCPFAYRNCQGVAGRSQQREGFSRSSGRGCSLYSKLAGTVGQHSTHSNWWRDVRECSNVSWQAGAIAVGLSGNLFPKQAVADGHWDAIAQQAQTLMHRLTSPLPVNDEV